ncbi:polysaccharide biosynthesis C-terminal domain-containing protein [Haloarcula rubripromontorii]|uniref:Polysaccharide biosynthesis protein n=1 Tax=Haloarcula rubripromontorii TaxID=1705562 RepID=A0A0M9AGE7_9EURY|nr:polysaccharide biosynthesis C-terminal domain-containing protein [Haloarcula rubripromontorii]KOX91479.1 polysaccharide biosynthesis protein [Haloarcula rubripromontorii]
MEVRTAILKLFSGNIALAIIEFAAVAGFTRAMGTAAIGSFFLFQAVIGMLNIPADLGVSKAVEKQLSAAAPMGEVLGTALVVKTLLVLPWLAGLVAFASYVEQYIGIPGVVPILVAGLVIRQVRELALRLLAGEFQVERNAAVKVFGKLTWVGTGAVFVVNGMGASGLVLGFVLGDLAAALGAMSRLDIRVGWPRPDRARALVGFGRYLFVGSVSGIVYEWIDVAILRLFVPVSLVGVYEIAWRVAAVALLLTNAIRTSLFPQISRWHDRDQFERIEDAFRTWVQLSLYATIPAFAGAVVLGPDLLTTIFGSAAAAGYPVLVVFMLEKILRSVQLVIGPALYAMDAPQLGYRGSVVAISVNVALNLALIPSFGIRGAAVATTLSAASAAVVSIYYVRQFVRIPLPRKRIVWSAIAATLMAGTVALVIRLFDPGWLRLGVGLGVGVLSYAGLLLANSGIRIQLRQAMGSFDWA